VRSGLVSARELRTRAPLALVDDDPLDGAVELRRRSGVLLVTKASPDAATWHPAFDAGA
jgi:hypothetical protein